MTSPTASEFLAEGGDMGALMCSIDWAQTPPGQVEVWPQSLRTAISITTSSSQLSRTRLSPCSIR